MTIKPLYPTVRPSLDLNFAATKRLDPRVTFSRSSSGTYTDADGLIKSAATNVPRFDHAPTTGESLGLLVEEARTNSNTYSEYFHVGNWTITSGSLIPNNVTAPNNTLTAQKLVTSTTIAQQRIISNGFSVPAGTYTFSVYAKAAGFSFMRLEHGADTTIVNFDLVQGVLGTNTGNGTIVNVGNGWYKCSMQIVASTTLSDFRIYVIGSATDARGSTLAGNGVGGIYIWGTQVELGAFPTSYIPTPATFTSRSSTATFYDANGVIQTAASGVARSNAFFPDSNGVFRPAELLLEAAGTNLLTYSEQFDNAAWIKDNATITANAVAAPDGLTTADKLVEGTGSYTLVATSAGPATTAAHTTSFFVKSAERTACYIRMAFGGASNWVTAKYDLVNGLTEVLSGSSSSFTAPASSIQKLPSGWWRISCTHTGGGGSPRIGLMDSYSGALDGVSGVRFYGGNGTSGIFVWGAQLETGSYPTSYIPTSGSTVTRSADVSTSATVTRSADVAQITGTNFSSWYRQDEGTVYCSFLAETKGTGAQSYQVVAVNDNTINEHIGLSRSFDPVQINANVVTGYTAQAALSVYPTPVGNQKIALTYRSDYSKLGVNGILSSADTSLTVPKPTQLLLGQKTQYTAYAANAPISRLTYWPVRLSDSTLAAITR